MKSYTCKYMLTGMSLLLCTSGRRFSVNKTAPSLCFWNMRLTPTWWTSMETQHCTWPPVSLPYRWCCSSWSTQPTSTHRTRWNFTVRLQIITVLTTHSSCLMHHAIFHFCSARGGRYDKSYITIWLILYHDNNIYHDIVIFFLLKRFYYIKIFDTISFS